MVFGVPGGRSAPKRGLFSYTGFPLLIIPVIIYNAIAWGSNFFMGDDTVMVDGVERSMTVAIWFANELFRVPMPTGGVWVISPGDILLAFAIFLLFLEIIKSTSTASDSIMNHAFSMILFIVCIVEFLLFAPFATSVFFLLTLMNLLDVLAGFMVTIVTARRDIAVGQDFS